MSVVVNVYVGVYESVVINVSVVVYESVVVNGDHCFFVVK